MNLEQTAATLERWIESSVFPAQLDLCVDAVNKFLRQRYPLNPEMPEQADKLVKLILRRQTAFSKLQNKNPK